MHKYGVALVACLALAGCAATQSKDEQFIGRLEARKVIPHDASAAARAGLVRQGHHWCDVLARPGVTLRMVERGFAQVGANWSRAKRARDAAMLGTAVRVYCPDAGKRLAGN